MRQCNVTLKWDQGQGQVCVAPSGTCYPEWNVHCSQWPGSSTECSQLPESNVLIIKFCTCNFILALVLSFIYLRFEWSLILTQHSTDNLSDRQCIYFVELHSLDQSQNERNIYRFQIHYSYIHFEMEFWCALNSQISAK